jgi:hypothetical protein
VSVPSANPLDPDVRRFLAAHVDSVEQLEVILLLRAEPARWWTDADVSTALRTAPASAAGRLRDLAARGILAAGAEGFRYAPGESDMATVIDRVAAAYRDRRVTVIATIYARPPDAVRELARAFRVGGKDDDDA